MAESSDGGAATVVEREEGTPSFRIPSAEREAGTSSSRVPSADLASLLRQKEHDIEIAAQIGQTLLERNRELQMRNEFLEESLSQSSEQTIQLRYELQRRVELLRFFAVDNDEDFGSDGDATTTLCRQVERLRRENVRLAAESRVMKKSLEGKDVEQRNVVSEIETQLATVSAQAAKLQAAITKKNEECTTHGENITRLLEEVSRRSNREKDLAEEKEGLTEQLEEAIRRERDMTEQMNAMQNLYAEVKAMFHDAEEELRLYRSKPSPYRSPSVDSLYDSLASELETSDSGRWTPRHRRDPVPRSLDLPPPPLAIEATHEDVTPVQEDVSLAEELAALTAPSEDVPDQPSPSIMMLKETEDVKDDEIPPPDPSGEPVEPLPTVDQRDRREKSNSPRVEVLSRPAPSPPQPRLMPAYLDAPPSRGADEDDASPNRSSSSETLSDYEMPVMGEPGIPGTRDLKASIKNTMARRVRRQLEKDYAVFRAKKGLRPSSFFSGGSTPEGAQTSPYLVGDGRSILPWRAVVNVGLQSVKALSGEGVFTRAELPVPSGPSPQSSPVHAASPMSGLRGTLLQPFSPSGGILLRRNVL